MFSTPGSLLSTRCIDEADAIIRIPRFKDFDDTIKFTPSDSAKPPLLALKNNLRANDRPTQSSLWCSTICIAHESRVSVSCTLSANSARLCVPSALLRRTGHINRLYCGC